MLGELLEWVLNLDREFAFLLALPFAVAIAGVLSEALRNRTSREPRGYGGSHVRRDGPLPSR
jgi:hypothetical protein